MIRRVLCAAAVLGALLAPAPAAAALPSPAPRSLHLGGLHLTPSSGDGTTVPAFTADHRCRTGTRVANVNTIDLLGTEQTLSKNVLDAATETEGFGAPFMTDMNTVQAAAGTPGTAEQFLLMVDCRVGPGHGIYTDAVVVTFDADAASTPTAGSSGLSTPIVLIGSAVVLVGLVVGLGHVLQRRRTQKGQRIRS
jgi:hypothetical protein